MKAFAWLETTIIVGLPTSFSGRVVVEFAEKTTLVANEYNMTKSTIHNILVTSILTYIVKAAPWDDINFRF